MNKMNFTHIPEKSESEFNGWILHTGLYADEAWKAINAVLDGIHHPWVMSNAPINTVWGRCLRDSDGECVISLAASDKDHAMLHIWPAVRGKIMDYYDYSKCNTDDEREMALYLIGESYIPEKYFGHPWNPLKAMRIKTLLDEWKYAWENGVIENGQPKFEAIKKLILDAASLN